MNIEEIREIEKSPLINTAGELMDAKIHGQSIFEKQNTCITLNYFLNIFINYKRENSNCTVNKHGRQRLNQTSMLTPPKRIHIGTMFRLIRCTENGTT